MTTIFEAVKAAKAKKIEIAKKPAKEIAATRKNFTKMINKIVAISQNMKLTAKDWDKIDAGVRRGLGAEKASVEKSASVKVTGGTFVAAIEPLNAEDFKAPTILFQIASTGKGESNLAFNEFVDYLGTLEQRDLAPLEKLGEVELFDEADFGLRPKKQDKESLNKAYATIRTWMTKIVSDFASKKKLDIKLNKSGK